MISLEEYKQSLTAPLSLRTLCFLIKPHQPLPEILLGFKKTGFGAGNYLGIGGKLDPGETLEEGMIREAQEEIGVTPLEFDSRGVLHFYFPYQQDPDSWNQEVHIFVATEWNGTPLETEEIAPKWFSYDAIPYEKMWADASLYLPHIIRGTTVSGQFLYDPNLIVQEHSVIVSTTGESL